MPARPNPTIPAALAKSLRAAKPGIPVEISASDAEILLTRCRFPGQGFRDKRGHHLTALMNEMTGDRWDPAVSLITLADVGGELVILNGHTRLSAAVKLGRALITKIEILPLADMDEVGRAFEKYDRFGKRDDSFCLTSQGFVIPRLFGAPQPTNFLNAIRRYARAMDGRAATLDDLRALIEKMRPIVEHLNAWTEPYHDSTAPGSMRTFVARSAAISAPLLVIGGLDGAQDFITQFWTAAPSPAATVRQRIDREIGAPKYRRRHPVVVGRWVAYAWNKRGQSKPLRFPEKDPVTVEPTLATF